MLKQIFYVIFILIVSGNVHSQSVTEYNDLERIGFLNELFQPKIQATDKGNTNGNSVYLSQIGSANEAIVNVKSSKSVLELNQYGENNRLSVFANAKEIHENINQTGNDHRLFNFVSDTYQSVVLNVEQTGENTHFEMYGANSISNKLEFKLNGNFKSLIVRNYK